MNQEEQGKKTSPVNSDAAAKEVIPSKPAKPTDELSEDEMASVAGGTTINTTRSNIRHGG